MTVQRSPQVTSRAPWFRFLGLIGRTEKPLPRWLLRGRTPAPPPTSHSSAMPRWPSSTPRVCLQGHRASVLPGHWNAEVCASVGGDGELIVERISPVTLPTWPATWWRELGRGRYAEIYQPPTPLRRRRGLHAVALK